MQHSLPLYGTRRFSAADLESFRAIRLEALQQEPSVFSSNYAREASFSEKEWLERLNNPDAAFFGLYEDHTLIGLTGIVVMHGQPQEALMIASYIRQSFRGKGLSALLYGVRIQWARDHGLKRITVSHRKSNAASAAANRNAGFRYAYEEPADWPDGITETCVYYHLEL